MSKTIKRTLLIIVALFLAGSMSMCGHHFFTGLTFKEHSQYNRDKPIAIALGKERLEEKYGIQDLKVKDTWPYLEGTWGGYLNGVLIEFDYEEKIINVKVEMKAKKVSDDYQFDDIEKAYSTYLTEKVGIPKPVNVQILRNGNYNGDYLEPYFIGNNFYELFQDNDSIYIKYIGEDFNLKRVVGDKLKGEKKKIGKTKIDYVVYNYKSKEAYKGNLPDDEELFLARYSIYFPDMEEME